MKKENSGTPRSPPNNPILTGKWANFKHNPKWLSETLDSTFERLGEMFEENCTDTHSGKFTLVLMGDRVEGLACADLVARTPISTSRISFGPIKVHALPVVMAAE